ncbi:MAG: asparaginase [Oscillospiraceae bacterium]
MKKILLLSTGGTIASTPSAEGLRPTQGGESLLADLGRQPYEVTVRDILTLDSSNIQPEEWQFIAKSVFELRTGFDGVVITHGTDTMAYTASMLTFMLPGIDLPVVFTGSQLPISSPLSDAQENLRCALAMAASGVPGVFLAFDRQVLLGCRAVKVRTTGFQAFESVNLPPVAEVSSDGLPVRRELIPCQQGPCRLEDTIDNRVALIKLIPGVDPQLFAAVAKLGCRGVVIEAFGSGGLHFIRRDLISALGLLVMQGISVVVCSQCLYERSDMSAYEVGRRALEKGVIPAEDMTTEAAVTKLMWALGRCSSPKEVAALFARSLAGEVSEPILRSEPKQSNP